MEISGKVFVVTGGGNGIARELVLQLLDQGASVAAVDVSKDGLSETAQLAKKHSKNLTTHVVDITDRKKVESLHKEIMTKHGHADAVVNVAGIIQPFVKVNDLDFSAIDRVINVNLYGTLNMIKTFLPTLLERPEAYIANVSSMGGYAPVPGQTVYGATKAAVKLLTEGLHSELMETNVHVTAIYPGAIATNIAQNSGMEIPANAESSQSSSFKTTTAQVAAETIINAIKKNAYKVFIGSDAKTMDRLTRLMPERAAKIIYNNMKTLLN